MNHTGVFFNEAVLFKSDDGLSYLVIEGEIGEGGQLVLVQTSTGQQTMEVYDAPVHQASLVVDASHTPQLSYLLGVSKDHLLAGVRANFPGEGLLSMVADFCDLHAIPFSFKSQTSQTLCCSH